MRTLETERLVIRPFVAEGAAEFKRLLDEAFGRRQVRTRRHDAAVA
jgi:hypothetical protein